LFILTKIKSSASVTQKSIANANKLAWSDERKNDLYAHGSPPKSRMWSHYLKMIQNMSSFLD